MSSAIGEDTARTINTGRETIGALASGAQEQAQRLFIVFALGFVGSFYALRLWVWEFLEAVAKSQMSTEVYNATSLITRTPFEVILLQAKIGMIAGVIITIPAAIYLSRDALRRRGFQSVIPISKTMVAGFVVVALALFCGGVVYAYNVFFPFMFEFLAENAISTGVKPSFGITEFTQFVALLTVSFGVAAQLPLFMGALSYTEVVPYETFRDKWRYAVILIFVFGAFFSPPDPFTQVMWAVPLLFLYVFSLGLAKVLTNTRRKGSSEALDGTATVKRRVGQFVGVIVVTAIAATAAIQRGLYDQATDELAAIVPPAVWPSNPTILGRLVNGSGTAGDVAAGFLLAGVLGFVVLIAYIIKVLQEPVYPRMDAIHAGDPEAIDLSLLDADAIDAAPPEVFLAMDEEEAMDHAREAMYDDDKEKAQAILKRYDSLQEAKAEETEGDGSSEGGSTSTGSAASADDEETVFSSTAAGIMDAFTEDETTEDDIGGYAYDLMFVFESLTSKAFWLVGFFMTVMGGTFFWLYLGGLGRVVEQFASEIPRELLVAIAERNGATDVSADDSVAELIANGDFVVAIHPVEVLMFEVKVSLLIALIAVLPLVCYFAWPALKDRGFVRGNRNTFLFWGVSLVVGFAVGIGLGFFWIAPAVISYLISDAEGLGFIVVSYRISHFAWLVLFTTVGVGFLFNIIVTMGLFHVGGIVPYRAMLKGWRVAVVGIFVFSALATPSGILTMLLFAIPLSITYLVGLVLLYVLTGGGRFFGGGGGEIDLDTGLFGGQ